MRQDNLPLEAQRERAATVRAMRSYVFDYSNGEGVDVARYFLAVIETMQPKLPLSGRIALRRIERVCDDILKTG